MYHGECLCGAVKFEIRGAINNIVYCHCSLCRKAQGSAFATNGNVSVSDFVITQGEEKLTAFAASSTHSKYFCSICGSPIISKNQLSPEFVRVRMGVIASPVKERPTAHIFVDSRAEWDEICDDLPQYSEYPQNSA